MNTKGGTKTEGCKLTATSPYVSFVSENRAAGVDDVRKLLANDSFLERYNGN